MEESDIRKLAEKHYSYIDKVCRLMYIEAFIHGYKHGNSDKADWKEINKLFKKLL